SLDLLLRMKNTRRRADPAIFRRHRTDLNNRAAEIAGENLQAAVARKRIFGCTQNRFVSAQGRRWPESEFPFVEIRLLRIKCEVVPGNSLRIWMQETCLQQGADEEAGSASRGEMVHVGGTVWIDPGQQRNRFGEIGEIVEHQDNAARASHGNEVDDMVGRASRRVQGDDA